MKKEKEEKAPRRMNKSRAWNPDDLVAVAIALVTGLGAVIYLWVLINGP